MIGRAVKRVQTRARTRVSKARETTRRASGDPALRVLLYHRVADDPRDPLALCCDRFEEQMELLHSEGFDVLDVVSALDLLYAGRLERRTIALTFDDGYVDNAVNALPVLERLGFGATVFVITDLAARRGAFLPGHGSSAPLLAWDEIRELDASSVLRFESHTVTHPDLTRVSDETSWDEIVRSGAELEAALGRRASAFCYPGGFFGAREVDYIARAGFRYGITCEPGLTTTACDPRLVRRTQIDPFDRMSDFETKLAGGHDAQLVGRRLYRRVKYGASDPLKAAASCRRMFDGSPAQM